nr:MAG TPA: hypothetical protein [Bacteriophage sp.]
MPKFADQTQRRSQPREVAQEKVILRYPTR